MNKSDNDDCDVFWGGFYPLSRGNYFKIVREFVKLMAIVKWCDFIKMCFKYLNLR